MKRFEVRDLEIIKNVDIPLSTLKRQISHLLQDSAKCNASVEVIDKQTGVYRVVLEGRLENTPTFVI